MPLAYSPIGQGRLTGKYSASNPPPGKRNFSAHPMEQVDAIVAELRRIGEAHDGKTPSQVALDWIIAKGAVPIPGAKNGAQAADNAGALGWSLTSDEVAALDAVALGRPAVDLAPRLAARLKQPASADADSARGRGAASPSTRPGSTSSSAPGCIVGLIGPHFVDCGAVSGRG